MARDKLRSDVFGATSCGFKAMSRAFVRRNLGRERKKAAPKLL